MMLAAASPYRSPSWRRPRPAKLVPMRFAAFLLFWSLLIAGEGEAERLPPLAFTTLDGETIELGRQDARFLVLNFWATWCTPCLKEMPELDALARARADVRVIGLAYEEIEVAELRRFLQRRPVSYPIVRIDPFAPPEGLPVPRGLPLTYVLAHDRRVVRRFLGPVTAAEIEAAIRGWEGQP